MTKIIQLKAAEEYAATLRRMTSVKAPSSWTLILADDKETIYRHTETVA